MHDTQLKISLMQLRADFYKVLSGLFLKEITEAEFRSLQAAALPDFADNALLTQGAASLAAFLKNPPANVIEELACDYARVFLGAGCIKETVAYPYESVYTSPGKLVCQEACEVMTKLLRNEGLAKSMKDIFEDHASLEFSLMARWCEKTAEALAAGDDAAADALLEKQADFVQHHLRSWMPAWAADIRACCGTDFYRAAANLTEGWIAEEAALFSF